MSDIYPSERDVQEHGGIRVGSTVLLTTHLLTVMRIAGVRERDRYATPAVVLRIVISDRWGWNSVSLRHHDGLEHTQSVEDLMVAEQEPARA